MKEHVDARVLGALRWVDAVTERTISSPLAVEAPDLRLVRNRSGLSVIVGAKGLEAYEACFDLKALPEEEVLDDASLEFDGSVSDPTGVYLPRSFKVKLPRVASPVRQPDGTRPANSLFDPIEIRLLPGPMANVASGWAQIRVSATDEEEEPLKNLYLRVVATADEEVLGRGMTDGRGEGLVIVPGLKLFAPADSDEDDEVMTSETEVRLEAIAADPEEERLNWTELDEDGIAPADTLTLSLKAGKTYSVKYSDAEGLELNT